MTFENTLFVIFMALILVNNGVQAYIHFEAYPLFKYVGKSEFSTYLTQYEQRLAIPLLVPYVLTFLINIALLFVRPDEVSLVAVLVLFVLNIAIVPMTVLGATPIYNRIKEAGEAEGADFDNLMKVNLIRLLMSTVISVIGCIIMIGLLS